MTFLVPSTVALTLSTILTTPASAGDAWTIDSTPFEVGQPAVVTVTGVDRSWFGLMFDTEPGDWTLPGGAWIGLGLSSDFAILVKAKMPGQQLDLSFQIGDDQGLVGMEFYLQVLALDTGSPYFTSSNRLDLVIGSGDGGGVVGDIEPDADLAVAPDTVFEVWVDGDVDESTVVAGNFLFRVKGGDELPFDVTLDERGGRGLIVVRPQASLPRGSTLVLKLEDGLLGGDGQRLGGERRWEWPVSERSHPRLFNTVEELDLMVDRIQSGRAPYADAWKNVKATADNGLDATPNPWKGQSSSDWNEYLDIYQRWLGDSRIAQNLAFAYHVTGDVAYAEKSKEMLLAWLVYDPEPVGKWYWSIQTNIAGLSWLDAVDWMWDYPGWTGAERAAIRAFLDDLAACQQTHQLDDRDYNPENIRSWTNTLLASIGWFNDRQDLVDFVLKWDGGQKFPFPKMLDKAIEPDGRMYDAYRGKQKPYWEVTYPCYHLHAWALLSEAALHHGVDLWHMSNKDGNTQLDAWRYLVPYIDGTIHVDGLTDNIKRTYCVNRSYAAHRIYREDQIGKLFTMFGGEPLYDPHIRKEAASITHRLPEEDWGVDDQPPAEPEGVVPESVGGSFATLRWNLGPVAEEGDLVRAWIVKRDGVQVGSGPECRHCDADLAPNRTYLYEVYAIDYAGNVGPSTFRHVTTKDL